MQVTFRIRRVASGAFWRGGTVPPSRAVTVRRAAARDEKRWRELFDGYCLFYKRTPSKPLTRYTWSRTLDDASPIHAILAEDRKEGVIGIANYVVHEHTLGLTPVCYLGDLHTRPNNYRARGLYDKFTPHSDFVRYTVYRES
jgi:hypothetical protein